MTPRDRHNALSNTLGESLWGFQMAMVAPATVLTVLLRHYGSGERLIGSVGAIESGAVLLPQVLGVYLFTSRKRRKVHLVLWHVLLMSPMLLVMGVLARGPGGMSPRAVTIALLVCFGWFQTAMGVIVAVWLDWLARLFGPAIRGRVFGISWCCSALAGTGGALAAGHVLETYPQPLAFSYLYMAASAMTVASMAAFCLMKDPAADAPADSPVAGTTGLLDSFKSSLGDRNFRAFIIGRIIATGGFCIGPFITVYYTSAEGGGLAASMVVSLGAALTVGSSIGFLVLGRMGDITGHRLGVMAGIIAQMAALAVVLVSAGRISCMMAFFGAGLAAAGGFLSHTNMLYETCPHDSRIAHITVGNLVMGTTSILCPLLAGVAAARYGTRSLFGICLVLSAGALLWFALRVREPRQVTERPAPVDVNRAA
ncbi:MAG TPA: MFS transporter [Planctomycetota bacterium]|nr:MFS transporter [Planctomycetota bacterium]